jgi:hypothetical protein
MAGGFAVEYSSRRCSGSQASRVLLSSGGGPEVQGCVAAASDGHER